jgi:hypothetical protein
MIGAWADTDAITTATATGAEAPEETPAPSEGTPTPAPPPNSGGIEQLTFLVGGTWVSTSGSKSIVEETCVWGTGNQSIRTTVVLRSGSEVAGQGHGRFNCSPTDQLMSHSDIESGGTDQRMYSRQVPIAKPVQEAIKQWHFEAVFLTDTGVQHRHMVLMQLGPNEMRVNQSVVKDGKPAPLASVTYGRKA